MTVLRSSFRRPFNEVILLEQKLFENWFFDQVEEAKRKNMTFGVIPTFRFLPPILVKVHHFVEVDTVGNDVEWTLVTEIKKEMLYGLN